jgi:arsenate reductase (thioredoxin)
MNKARVLFLCTANSARSQMAEALLRHRAGDRFEPHSAGIEPKELNPYTRLVLEEMGLDISGQYSKGVRVYLGTMIFAYLITVCADAEERCPTTFVGVNHRLHWAFDDPAAFEGTDEEKLNRFREIRDQIDQKIQAWVAEEAVKA